MTAINYHLDELEIAKNKDDVSHINPVFSDSDKIILDIGCGVGQMFVAIDPVDKMCIGIDIDENAIRYGIENYGDKIQYIYSNAKKIPLPANLCDFIYSRVALPYTNIPKTLSEIKRVLKDDGRVWFTLHKKQTAIDNIKLAIKKRSPKEFARNIYVYVNGYILKYFHKSLPFLNGEHESWQDAGGFTSLMNKKGFDVDITETDEHMIAEGQASKFRL